MLRELLEEKPDKTIKGKLKKDLKTSSYEFYRGDSVIIKLYEEEVTIELAELPHGSISGMSDEDIQNLVK